MLNVHFVASPVNFDTFNLVKPGKSQPFGGIYGPSTNNDGHAHLSLGTEYEATSGNGSGCGHASLPSLGFRPSRGHQACVRSADRSGRSCG